MSRARSFGFCKYSPPEKTVADYSEFEKERFRAAFKPIANRHRIIGFILLGLCFTVFLLSVLLKRDNWWWFCCVVLFAIIYSILLGPVCPACKLKVDDAVRAFCPECGGKASEGRFFKAPECLSYGQHLRRGKRRSYKIRCCTHCGVFLDSKGI